MSFKSKIKNSILAIIGENNYLYMMSKYKAVRLKKVNKGKEAIMVSNPNTSVKIFSENNKHVFFGYFDIQQLSRDQKKLLVLIVDKKAVPDKDDAIIGYYDLDNDDKFVKLTSTKTWCWQQGARLRWHPVKDNVIFFNDMENGEYVCREYDIIQKTIIKTYTAPLYDIDGQAEFGLSTNFSRLQRLRPGYGYYRIKDQYENIKAPEDDGIFKVDMKNNSKKMLVSLKELSLKDDSNSSYEHYINHISIAPDGKNFIFFHIYNKQFGAITWKTILYVMDMEGKEKKILEEVDNVSHYCWKNNEEIIITAITKEKKQYYAIYNIVTGEKTVINENVITRDGHPTVFCDSDVMITDTYPDKVSYQELFTYDFIKEEKSTILKAFCEPSLFGEKRCDLHPRVSMNRDIITIDSTFKDQKRSVVLVNYKIV